jgi:hypothetical protein
MKAGVAQVNITPPVGIPQRGAASRKNVWFWMMDKRQRS